MKIPMSALKKMDKKLDDKLGEKDAKGTDKSFAGKTKLSSLKKKDNVRL